MVFEPIAPAGNGNRLGVVQETIQDRPSRRHVCTRNAFKTGRSACRHFAVDCASIFQLSHIPESLGAEGSDTAFFSYSSRLGNFILARLA